jgi:hypothetical protein
MVNTGLNLGNDANIKHVRQTKDRNCHKVNLTNKGTVYFKIFHKNIRGLGKKTPRTTKSFASRLPSCFVPNRTSPKVLTIGKGSC